MERQQFRVLYRQFLFRMVDLELLSKHAGGGSVKLLGQLAALLIFSGIGLTLGAAIWAANFKNDRVPRLVQLIGAWTMVHFLVATTMLVVGVFAVLTWDSMFPNRLDLSVLGPLPVRARTIFLAKAAALGAMLGVALLSLQGLAGIAWPLALAQYGSEPVPALVFEPALPALPAEEFPAVMDRDIAPMLRRLDLAAADGGAGIVLGVTRHGVHRIMAYGAAKPGSLFEIGSISKTFTGLLLAQRAAEGRLNIQDPVRNLLPIKSIPAPKGFEITLLDLVTHRSGLPRMPAHAAPAGEREALTQYGERDLLAFIERRGLEKPVSAHFLYSNLGFALLGEALSSQAHLPYGELLHAEITGPLRLNETATQLSPAQILQLMQGYDNRHPTARWDLDAFAGAGGIRSSAGDMLRYLEAQLHPERTPLEQALKESQRPRDYVTDGTRIALAWMYDPSSGIYEHSGATGGFTSFAFFNPKRDFAAVGMMNTGPAGFPFITLLEQHVQERLAGEPALSLAPVAVAPTGPWRSLLAYWITILAAALFVFCCILSLQGITAQLLPRRWFLRISAPLQLAVFCLFVCGYFLQRSPISAVMAGERQSWLAWIPSYWFVGLYQELSGSIHPALTPLARRAWVGLLVALGAALGTYSLSYLRMLRGIDEEPDIVLHRQLRLRWRFGGLFETAIVQFCARSLFRSRWHRLIFSFYLAVAGAFTVFFLNAPSEITGPDAGSPWAPLSVQLLASSLISVSLGVVGCRVAFSLPLDLDANWVFQALPVQASPACLAARRRALLILGLWPALFLWTVVLLSVWPWRLASLHLLVLALLGFILVESGFDGVHRIPFACSYLPGRANLHITFWFWIYLVLACAIGAALKERDLLNSPVGAAALLASLGIVASFLLLRNRRLASGLNAELRFEEVPEDQLVELGL